MNAITSYRDELLERGFAIIPDVLDSSEIVRLISFLDNLGQSESIRRKGGIFAIRNLLDVAPEIGELARATWMREIVNSILDAEAIPVRGILFDKTPEANWKVPWHQDVTIAVASKREVDGFGPWSIKAGVLHVQPPADVLESMVSVRMHLDPCGAENGALKVVAGSHRLGRLPEAEVVRLAEGRHVGTCAVNAGDAVLMRPLLLHASSASTSPLHRRVIHFDFASSELPGGLQWAAGR